ncbi:MAG: hypothetical protein GXP38_07790 [Chloroflexi bacterium]|nr:hypothetical protein [Chloroflexota bacterium]
MNNSKGFEPLEAELNSFEAEVRSQALAELQDRTQRGQITLPPEQEVANMHAHTFFSYNAYGLSPSGLAWQGKKQGIKLMGIVDFDVLDGVDEWLAACDLVGLRGSAGIETRVFLPEFADREINSPGEPGVLYHMGIGFTSGHIPAAVAPIALELRERARHRNLGLLERISDFLKPLSIDYARDVLPLTPNGNATERHMVMALIITAQRNLSDPTSFWAERLGLTVSEVKSMAGDDGTAPALQNAIRKKLMKRGGVGYVQPGPDTFPSIDTFHQFILACGALPCAAWLDGTSEGEQAMPELLDLLIAKGVVALNIIPDRNWNIADPHLRQQKVENLYEVVALAQQRDLPLNVGTEMNSFGQKFVDDFATPELAPVRQAFLDGAYFIYGHTMLGRALNLGFQSEWAAAHLPVRRDRNIFYTKAGRLIPPGYKSLAALQDEISLSSTPEEILAVLNKGISQ